MDIQHVIDDSNFGQFVDAHLERTGGVQSIYPRESKPGELELRPGVCAAMYSEVERLVPASEWPDRIKALTTGKRWPADRDLARKCEDTNQQRYGYCWSASLTQCVERKDADEDNGYNELAWESLGGVVGWRNEGYYPDKAIVYASQHGIATRVFVPALPTLTRTPSTMPHTAWKTGWEADALKHCPLEWYDTDPDRNVRFEQLVSWILCGGRAYCGFNWWGHAVMLDSLVLDGTTVCPSGPNSWGPGERYLLKGSKKYPDEAYLVRNVTYSS